MSIDFVMMICAIVSAIFAVFRYYVKQCLGDGSSFDHQASVKRCFSEHRFPNGFPNENTPEITQIPGAFYVFFKRSFSERQSQG